MMEKNMETSILGYSWFGVSEGCRIHCNSFKACAWGMKLRVACCGCFPSADVS